MKIFLLKRQPGVENNNEGEISYRFMDNFIGAEVDSEKKDKKREAAVNAQNITVNNISRDSIVQPSRTGVTFRVSIPLQKCRIRVNLTTDPNTWNSDGDGITFKLALNDNLLENFFDKPGMVGDEERSAFLKPRGFFFRPRTIYMNYLDPKHNPDQRKWHSVSIDMSRFAGKVVDLEFVSDPGPTNNDISDIAVWGDPVIEVY